MNLRLHYKETYVLQAESFSTSPTVIFPGRDLCRWREAIFENSEHVQVLARVDIDRRNPSRNTPVTKNVAYAYGHRPRNSPLWFLSAYEFMRSWTLELATYPKDADAEDDNEAIHAHLTASGREKLKAANEAKEKADMKPGEDYIVKDTGSHKYGWFPFDDNDYTRQYRNNWVFVQRARPHEPLFAACPMPPSGAGQQDRNATIIVTYSRALRR